MKKPVLLIITVSLIVILIYSLINLYSTLDISSIEVDLEELSKNKEDYVGKNVRTEGFVVKSVGAFWGATYVIRTADGIQQKSKYDGIALSGVVDLEPFVAYTHDGRSFYPVNVKPVTTKGIVIDEGNVWDAPRYPLEIKSIKALE